MGVAGPQSERINLVRRTYRLLIFLLLGKIRVILPTCMKGCYPRISGEIDPASCSLAPGKWENVLCSLLSRLT